MSFRRLQFEALEDRRLLVAGALDPTFGTGGRVTTPFGSSTDAAGDIALQSDGKMVVVGYSATSVNHFAVARYNTNGTLDTSFDGDGKVTTLFTGLLSEARAVAIAADGKIVVAGKLNTAGGTSVFALARYNTNGSLDTSFDTDGMVTTALGTVDDHVEDIIIQPDGKIIVVGSSYGNSTASNDFAIARYNTNGSLDTSFSGDGMTTVPFGVSDNDGAYAVALQTDGKIVLAGYSNLFVAVTRLATDGSLDTTFAGTGNVTTAAGTNDAGYTVAIQSDGKIVVAGGSSVSNNRDFMVVRYNTNGSLDNSFDGDGRVRTPIGTANESASDVVIQPDGKIVLAGWAFTGASNDFAVVRYNSDGSLDSTFDTDGKVTTAFGTGNDQGADLVRQSDGKLVVVGRSFNGSDYDFALARYEGVSVLPTGDYSQNGRVDASDYVLWRKTSGATGVPPFSGADGSGNGSIGPEDYTIWRSHYGQIGGGGAGSGAAVVENASGAQEETLSPATLQGSGWLPAETEQEPRIASQNPESSPSIPNEDNALTLLLAAVSASRGLGLSYASASSHESISNDIVDVAIDQLVEESLAASGLASESL